MKKKTNKAKRLILDEVETRKILLSSGICPTHNRRMDDGICEKCLQADDQTYDGKKNNAGCDKCGTHDRMKGSKYCAECTTDQMKKKIKKSTPRERLKDLRDMGRIDNFPLSRRAHTPTPWMLGKEDSIQSANGDSVLEYYDYEGLGFIDSKDAAFIVRAVNAHNELVESLKLSWQQLDLAAEELADRGAQQEAENCTQRAMEARAALAKAEGR